MVAAANERAHHQYGNDCFPAADVTLYKRVDAEPSAGMIDHFVYCSLLIRSQLIGQRVLDIIEQLACLDLIWTAKLVVARVPKQDDERTKQSKQC